MPWQSRRLRGERVWARVTPDGRLAATGDGRVEILYQPGGKVYRAAARNLEADAEPEMLAEADAAPGSNGAAPTVAMPSDAFIIYADGACRGNPGPCGIGV